MIRKRENQDELAKELFRILEDDEERAKFSELELELMSMTLLLWNRIKAQERG